MHKLAINLPPFSPDYSGACSALFELGGMVIIHDASGCTGNYTGYDEPRWYHSQSLIYCSALREIDAILGNDEKFICKIIDAAKDLNPKFICILGSPVPMVIGTDFEGIAMEIENRTGIPSFGFQTTGLDYYDKGVAKALLAIAKRFITQARPKASRAINLLGATPIDFSTGDNIKNFREEFTARGFKVISTFAMDSSLEQLIDSSAASVNVVISASGLPLAKYFKEKFNTPYVIGQPIGYKYSNKLGELIEQSEKTGENQIFKAQENEKSRILLIGEQVTMHSLRNCMHEDYQIHDVSLGCFFEQIPQITLNSDFKIKSEKNLKRIINEGQFNCIIGDPFFEKFCSESSKYISIPHVAVSSKIYWSKPTDLAGDKINTILKGVF